MAIASFAMSPSRSTERFLAASGSFLNVPINLSSVINFAFTIRVAIESPVFGIVPSCKSITRQGYESAKTKNLKTSMDMLKSRKLTSQEDKETSKHRKDMKNDDVGIRIICQDDPLKLDSGGQCDRVCIPHREFLTTSTTVVLDHRCTSWIHGGDRTSLSLAGGF